MKRTLGAVTLGIVGLVGCGKSGDVEFQSTQSSGTTTGPGSGGSGASGSGGEGATGSGGEGATGATGGTGGQGGGSGGAGPDCGDGKVDAGEDCDGADLGGKTCNDFGYSDPSTLGCTAACTHDPSGCHATCDGALLEQGEECDGAFFNGVTCVDYGFSSPDGLACDNCVPDSRGCQSTCGDSKKEPGEICDGASLDGYSCQDFGFVAAAGLTCQDSCQDFDTSGCTANCNGTLEPGEECDGAQLNGATCQDFGFADPAGLKCTACALDASGCKPVCGNGSIEPGEGCDDGNAAGGDGCSSICQAEGTTCQNAVPVTLNMGPSIVLSGSTVGGGQHAIPNVKGCSSANGDDRIFAVTATAKGFFTARLVRSATTYDSVLYATVVCDAAVGPLQCADSYDPIGNMPLFGGELISFRVQANQTVFVYVDGFAGEGDYQLVLDLSHGQNCNDPVPIVIENGTPMYGLGTIVNQTDTNSSACGGGSSDDVVYQVSRGTLGKVDVLVNTASYDSVLYTQSQCNHFSNNTGCAHTPGNGGEVLTLGNLSPNQSGFAWVDGFTGAEGTYELQFSP
jgi:cysteine-rich repeat protein